MRVRSIMTALAATTLTLTAGTTVVTSPAHAAGGTRTLSGPATGDADVYLTYCRMSDAPGSKVRLAVVHTCVCTTISAGVTSIRLNDDGRPPRERLETVPAVEITTPLLVCST